MIDQPNNLKKENYTYNPNRLPDPRVISLTPASIRFLKSIGLWEKLDKKLIKFISGMQIWENKGSSFVHLEANDIFNLKNNSILNLLKENNLLPNTDFINLDVLENIPDDYVCALIEINHMLVYLQEMLKDKINIIYKNIEFDKIDIENTDDYCYLNLKNENKTIRSKLLVASDGVNSVIRNKLKMQTTGYEYNETGLVCTIRGNNPSDVAFQRFLHNGIFALLPLYDDLFSIVCSMPKNINEDLKNLKNEDFLNFINNVLHNPSEFDTSQIDRLRKSNNYKQPPVITEILSKRFDFNLQMQYVNNPVDKNCILIGDASHAVHPMAGQGLNLGISDSSFLADEIIKSLNIGRRINDSRSLADFAFKSQLNTRIMIATMESIKAIYNPTNPVISLIRNFGMSISNSSDILRGLIILSASGLLSQPSKFAWEK